MLVGYILEQVLGYALAALVMYARRQDSSSRLETISERTFGSFYEYATFLAFSLEIAAIVVLVRESFGITTAGMGNATVQITQAVSVLVLLPLAYGLLIEITNKHESAPQKAGSGTSQSPNRHAEATASEDEYIATQRFILLVLCWLLAFFPFYSKMGDAFGPSQISSSGVITPPDFAHIQSMCSAGVKVITGTEDALMSVFEMLSFIPLSLVILGRILWLGLKKHHSESKLYLTIRSWHRKRDGKRLADGIRLAALTVIPLLATGLLWTVFRAQQFQREMAASTGSGDSDNQWTFGQVVAVTVFAPVLVEAWSAFRSTACGEADDGRSEEASSERSTVSSKRG